MDVEQLRGLSPLDGISEAGLERVAACAAEVTREAGQVLALPDDPGQGMYVIREGTVAVELRSGTIELGPGDFFGELSVLDGRPRNASVIADGPTTCLALPTWDFETVLREEPSVAIAILRELAGRLRDLTEADRH